MPKMRTKSYSQGNPAWLKSEHGVYNAQSFVFKAADFNAVVAKYGFVPTGYPVTISGDKVVPVTAEATVPAGHILWDQEGKYDDQVAVLLHGIVALGKLPKLTNDKPLNKPTANAPITYVA